MKKTFQSEFSHTLAICVMSYLVGAFAACGSSKWMVNKKNNDSYSISKLDEVVLKPSSSTGGGETGSVPLTQQAVQLSKFPLILMYHDVIPNAPSTNDVTPELFKEQLDWLQKNGYETITIEEYFAYKNKSISKVQLPAKPVLLTFDDGYKGVIEFASKELIKRNFNATLFAHTRFVGSKSGRAKMTWEDYNTLEALNDVKGRPLFRVYSHTATHPVKPNGLASLELPKLQKELVDSKVALETKLSLKIPRIYIAWPEGDYDAQVVAEAARAGYEGALAVWPPKAELRVPGLAQPLHFQYGRLGIGRSVTSLDVFVDRIRNW